MMKVWSITDTLQLNRPVVTIGIFDGVHLGHRFILDQLKEQAASHGGDAVVLTLWPHPRIILGKDVQGFRLLHTREEKIRELEASGIDHLVFIPFNREIASLEACDFAQEYLVNKLGVEVLLLGYDNRFGKDRKGDPEGLSLCAKRNNFRIEELPEIKTSGKQVSSTRIREAILKGKIDQAADLLGYSYYMGGNIVEGNHIGRQMGFPTANIHPLSPYKLIPMNGVYAIRCELRGKLYGGMLNIGFRPTLDSAMPVKTIEAHLFDVQGDFYGEEVLIHFIQRVREEIRFKGLQALKEQLRRDELQIRKLL